MLKNKLSVKNNRKITQFFKNTKNTQNETESSTEPKNSTNSNNFYVECVEIDEQTCVENDCVEKKNALELKLKNSQKKLEQIKSAVELCGAVLAKKRKKIEILEAQLGPKQNRVEIEENLFQKFTTDFTETGLAQLRSIDGCVSNDSTFMLFAVRDIYRNNLDRLGHISVTGRTRAGIKKEKMSPAKHSALKNIFTDRLEALNLEHDQRMIRLKRVNVHINQAIQNISNPRKNEMEKLNDAINLNQHNLCD